jgi:hypothetical protein
MSWGVVWLFVFLVLVKLLNILLNLSYHNLNRKMKKKITMILQYQWTLRYRSPQFFRKWYSNRYGRYFLSHYKDVVMNASILWTIKCKTNVNYRHIKIHNYFSGIYHLRHRNHTNFMTTIQLQSRHNTPCFFMLALWRHTFFILDTEIIRHIIWLVIWSG